MTVYSQAYEEAADLINRYIVAYRLHEDWPVDLSPLASRFPLVEEDVHPDGPRAYAVPSKRPDMPTWIVVDRCLPAARRRCLYAHEIAHALLGHFGSLRALGTDRGWLHDRQEAEAWALAAKLLIPLDAWGWGDPVEEVAARCGVPVWVAKKYPGNWVK